MIFFKLTYYKPTGFCSQWPRRRTWFIHRPQPVSRRFAYFTSIHVLQRYPSSSSFPHSPVCPSYQLP